MGIIDRADRLLAVHLIVQQLSAVQGNALRELLRALRDQQDWPQCLRAAKAAEVALVTVELLCADKANRELEHIAKQVAWLSAQGIKLIAWGDADYPVLLEQIAQPPAFLYLKGRIELLQFPQLAIVGARKATPLGLKTAYQLAAALAQAGLLVSSGMALGIDAQCHRAALDQNLPTLAVLGTGLDQVYPRQHVALSAEIASKGLLISEFPLGSPPRAHHFPQRNRLLSGLSLGVLVVEASIKSGSLITARYALEQGREVFAVPGSIHNSMVAGCHVLLKEGASLVQEAQDVSQILLSSSLYQFQWRKVADKMQCWQENPALLERHEEQVKPISTQCQQLYELIEDSGSSLQELQTASHLQHEQLCATLLDLQCQQKIISRFGLYFKC